MLFFGLVFQVEHMLNDRLLQFTSIDLQDVKARIFSFVFSLVELLKAAYIVALQALPIVKGNKATALPFQSKLPETVPLIF